MKKYIVLIFCLLLLTGCGSSKEEKQLAPSLEYVPEPEESNQPEAASATVDELMVSENKTAETEDKQQKQTADGSLDLDLTEMSSTMIYSEVFNMLNEPDNYVGKKIRMKGLFGYYTDKEGKDHFGCVITDATACCSQGIEFVLIEEHSYPDEYPELGSKITVVGDYDYYFDGNFINGVLYDAYFE